MKKQGLIIITFVITIFCSAQEMKWKHFRLKSSMISEWHVKEYPGNKNWDDVRNEWCSCAALYFFKNWKNKKLNVIVYPIAQSPDSIKYQYVGKMKFMPVEKYEQIRNRHFSFRKERSFLSDESGLRYDAFRYYTQKEKHAYIIYTWTETLGRIDTDTEKELYSLINALEPL